MSRSARIPQGVDATEGGDRRLWPFYALMGALLLVLAAGLAWQQLLRADLHNERERTQGQRRVLVPGPRGRILDREGRVLAGTRPRLAVTLALDTLGREFREEFAVIRKGRRAAGGPLPPAARLEQDARTAVVRRYLDQLDAVLGRHAALDADKLQRHFSQQLLLPYLVLDDLTDGEYARLIEQLPVNSPLQVFSAGVRDYPLGPLAAHALGYVGADDETSAADDLPGYGLKTFPLPGTEGRTGLEKRFDDRLHGVTGYTIFRVSPAGYRLNPPLEKRPPARGRDFTTSLDASLQDAAEKALGEQTGAAVALDVRTGEVLVLASAPGYDLQKFSPRIESAVWADTVAHGALFNRAVNGLYPPGSTFKILTTIAALRSGAITPDDAIVNCDGELSVAGQIFKCYNGLGHHGEVLLRDAIAQSCDIYFYTAGERATPAVLAREARRFHLGQPTGIEAGETEAMLIPDAAWKLAHRNEKWFPGDTANMAIGQGFVRLTPLGMACFVASVARNELFTTPTLLHHPDAPTQRHEPIGLTPAQRAALLDGMEDCTTTGTAKILTTVPALRIPGLRIAGKTGTAQIPNRKNVAWFICFAPRENPRIAIAVAVEGETSGEETSGGRYAAPVAQAILKEWWKTQPHPDATAPATPSAPGLPALPTLTP